MADEYGTVVERTGLAVVHQGELIVPAPGAEAVLGPAEPETATHYHFPIEVVVVGDIGEEVLWQLEERIWQRMHDALA